MFVIFHHSSNSSPIGIDHKLVRSFYPGVVRKDPMIKDSEIVKRYIHIELNDGTDLKVTQSLLEVQEILNVAIQSEVQSR